jgi:hypothetical protein
MYINHQPEATVTGIPEITEASAFSKQGVSHPKVIFGRLAHQQPKQFFTLLCNIYIHL